MVREVLTINVGQCGVQLGSTIWEQYNTEHVIDPDGQCEFQENHSFQTFYHENDDGKYMPRNLMVDLEPTAIEQLKASKWSKLFTYGALIANNDGSGGVFARAHYGVGSAIMPAVTDALRLLVEDCDHVQGFMINHAVGGGTGSGLATQILETLAINYRKKSRFGCEVFPFNDIYSECYVEEYNTLLSMHWLLDYTDVSLVFDNRKLHQLCKKKLFIDTPSFFHLNSLIAKVVSSATASLRFEGELNVDLNEFSCGGWSTFPRLHFMTTSMAPLLNKEAVRQNKRILVDGYVRHHYCNSSGFQQTQTMDSAAFHGDPPLYQDVMNMLYAVYDISCNDNFSVQQISENVFNPDNFCVECADFDTVEDKYMQIMMNYRGPITAKQANATVQWLKLAAKVTFVEWCPTGFKIGLHDRPPVVLEDDVMANTKTHAMMIGNNTLIGRFFADRVIKPCRKMWRMGAFWHWFNAEGMEAGEIAEALDDLGFLEKDYLDVLSEQATDEADDDDDDY